MALKTVILFCITILTGYIAHAQKYVSPKGEELFLQYSNVLPEDLETKRPVQGLAIHRNYAFSLRDKGMCVILDLKKKEYVNSFMLEGNTSHCNNAGFGKEKYTKDSQFPLLYISECMGSRCCYVTDITLQSSRIVQKIFYDSDEFKIAMDWIVDAQNGYIYIYGGKHYGTKYLKRFRLPKLSDSDENGEVHLTPADVLQEIAIEGIAIAQGSKIHCGKAFLPDGCSPKGNRLHIVDLTTGKKIAEHFYSDQKNEPEGLDFKGKALYTVFHPVGQPARHSVIYRTDFKKLK